MLVKRYLAWIFAGICGLVFVMFAGIALMLGALFNQFHWALVAVPTSALLLMLVAIAKAKASLNQAPFTELKAQIDSDIQALKAVA